MVALRLHSLTCTVESAPHALSTPVPDYPGITGDVVLADPPLACTTLNNAADVAGKIVLVFAGGCYAEDKTEFAYQAGALAVLTESQAPFVTLQFFTDPVAPIPSICITPADVQTLCMTLLFFILCSLLISYHNTVLTRNHRYGIGKLNRKCDTLPESNEC